MSLVVICTSNQEVNEMNMRIDDMSVDTIKSYLKEREDKEKEPVWKDITSECEFVLDEKGSGTDLKKFYDIDIHHNGFNIAIAHDRNTKDTIIHALHTDDYRVLLDDLNSFRIEKKV